MPYTRFASGNWAHTRIDWPGPGEVLDAPRTWETWDTPFSARGQDYCGTPEQFRDGLTTPATPPHVLYDVWGLPACCAIGLPGGTADGGGAYFGNPTGGTLESGTGFPSRSRLLVADGGTMEDGTAGDVAGYFEGEGGNLDGGEAGNLDGYWVADGGGLDGGEAGNLDGYFEGEGGTEDDGGGY